MTDKIAAEYGVFYTADGIHRVVGGMERMIFESGPAERDKLRELINALKSGISKEYGDMIAIVDPAPVQYDFVAIAETLMDDGLFDEAIEFLERFTPERPNYWKPKVVAPQEDYVYFWNRNEFDSYINFIRKGEPKNTRWLFPSYSKAHYLLAYLYIDQGNYQSGKIHLNKGLLLEPDHPKLLTEKGILLGRMGLEREALEVLKRVPNSRFWNTDLQKASAYRQLAVTFANLDQIAEAKKTLQKVITLCPEDDDLRDDLNYLRTID
ncbi:MAG: tetratricopeptide repeat protein [Pyrinomonadaceae bacterium]